MTGLIALEELNHDSLIQVPKEAVGIEGSSLYLEEGEMLSVKDMVYGLILQSANDAAAALAIEISGSIEAFAEKMNERARALSLKDTNFKNPHGLDEDGHYTTAHDLALIAAEALNNESFLEISSTRKKEIESSHKTRLLVNHNKMLKSYEGCVGVKTGYTKKSGRSLVSAAEREGLRLIAVTINAPDDWSDHTKLLDLGYSLLCKQILAEKYSFSYDIPVINGEKDSVKVSNTEELSRIIKLQDKDYAMRVKLSRYTAAPIKEGDVLGSVIFSNSGEIIKELPLVAQETINKKAKKGFFSFGKD
jgi:D-alanyl-D-alanine carboxypeptidase